MNNISNEIVISLEMLFNELSHQVSQPENFKKELFPYQLSTIYKMEELEKKKIVGDSNNPYSHTVMYTDFGILSNKVGSGKTITLLGLCKRNMHKYNESYMEDNVYILNKGSNFIMKKSVVEIDNTYINTTLIVVSGTLLKQWENELLNTDLTYFTIKQGKDIDKLDINNFYLYDVILCSVSFSSILYAISSYIKWNRIIIDEADSIRRLNDIKFKYRFIWFVSATMKYYSDIVSKEINDINHTIPREFHHLLNVCCEEDYINISMGRNIITKYYIKCLTPVFLNILKDVLTDDITNMVNAGDIESAIKSLGGTVENDTDLITLYTTKANDSISDYKKEISYVSTLYGISDEQKNNRIRSINARIDSLQTRLDSITEKINTIKDTSCGICLDDIVNPVITKCCNNIFCLECFSYAMKANPKCITCRTSFTNDMLVAIVDKKPSKPKKSDNMLSKNDNCIKILKANPTGKFLIYSNYDNTFINLQNTLSDNNLICKEVKGGADIVNRILKSYDDNKVNILLLNSRNKGSGLNLHKTTDIIIYHAMSAELETQIIGRAIRLGRDSAIPLNIHYLRHDNE